MSPEHTKYLFETYPNLYRLRNDPRQPISYGFECGDGWFDIIDRLSDQLEKTDVRLSSPAVQIKQKFGQLRFYLQNASTADMNRTWEAQLECDRTCEVCGAQPALNTAVRGYWQVNCDECLTKRRNRR